MTKETISS